MVVDILVPLQLLEPCKPFLLINKLLQIILCCKNYKLIYTLMNMLVCFSAMEPQD